MLATRRFAPVVSIAAVVPPPVGPALVTQATSGEILKTAIAATQVVALASVQLPLCVVPATPVSGRVSISPAAQLHDRSSRSCVHAGVTDSTVIEASLLLSEWAITANASALVMAGVVPVDGVVELLPPLDWLAVWSTTRDPLPRPVTSIAVA